MSLPDPPKVYWDGEYLYCNDDHTMKFGPVPSRAKKLVEEPNGTGTKMDEGVHTIHMNKIKNHGVAHFSYGANLTVKHGDCKTCIEAANREPSQAHLRQLDTDKINQLLEKNRQLQSKVDQLAFENAQLRTWAESTRVSVNELLNTSPDGW